MIKWDRTKGRPEPISALNKILEIENDEPLVDLRVVAPILKLPRTTTIPFCRKRVAEMAVRAAESLPPGIHLAVTDAWRPMARQVAIYEWFRGCVEESFPHLNYSQQRRKICRWVAPVDQKAPPGHCTGAALDVILLDDAGEQIDVYAPYDRFQASPTYTLGLSPDAAKHRTILVEAMLGAGFSNCRDEWWHYSFGDAGWAVRMGESTCDYGLKELDLQIWESAHMEWLEVMKERANPFNNPPE